MKLSSRAYDTLHMGPSSIDLYANEIGAPFAEIKSFAAFVGGSPTNCSGYRTDQQKEETGDYPLRSQPGWIIFEWEKALVVRQIFPLTGETVL